MPTYQLNIQIDGQGLQTITAAKQRVTIVKSVSSGAAVAWVAFSPMESNTITWQETYSVYASTTAIMDGAQIVTASSQVAAGGNTYTLAGGQFDGGSPNLPPTQYGVFNNDPDFKIGPSAMVTSGLYQGAVVNGQSTASPLNAVEVPYNQPGLYIPIEKIMVFTSNYQNNGLVISTVSSSALTVDLTTTPTQTIHYNDGTNQFVPGQLPAMSSRR